MVSQNYATRYHVTVLLSLDVMILIDNKSLEELEKEASEAEQLAQEAQRRARELRMKANRASGHGYVSD